MYCTIVDISFLEMGFMRLIRRPHYTVMVQDVTSNSYRLLRWLKKFRPWGYGHKCIGNDGYPSGFL